MPQKTGRLYEFGPFVLDVAGHVLLRDGKPVPLTPKTFDVLVLLVENSGRMLSKSELMESLWPDSCVEESNLTQQISMIRRALGEKSGGTPYIVTVQGRGYRFAVPVVGYSEPASPLAQKLPEAHAAAEVPPRAEIEERADHGTGVIDLIPRLGRHVNRRSLVLLALIACVLAAGIWFAQRQISHRHASGGPQRLGILPFQSLRRDPGSDFLGFSLADAVIMKLGYVNSLIVRPSSAVERYRNAPVDLRRIAADLHVDKILTGNFVRDGDDIRITSQLIDVETENIVWKGTFDLKYDRLLTVQDRVAGEIIRGLQLTLSPLETQRLKSDEPAHPLAYEYYLRGVDLYARNDFKMAIKMLEKSAEIDPHYALTWAHLGRAHTANASFELAGRDEYRAAQAAYEKALSLEPSQIEAQIYMANRLTDTGRVESAVPLLRNVLKTNSKRAEAHWELGYAYRFAGMLHESVAESECARLIDPGVKLSTSALNGYLYLGQYDAFLRSLPPDNDSALITFYRGLGEFYKNNRALAAQHFDRAFESHPSLLQARVGSALSHSIAGRKQEGLRLVRETEKLVSERGVGDPEAIFKIAQAYAVLGDKKSALRVLRISIESGFFSYPYLSSDPLLNDLHHEPEFIRLMEAARKRYDSFKRTFQLSGPMQPGTCPSNL